MFCKIQKKIIINKIQCPRIHITEFRISNDYTKADDTRRQLIKQRKKGNEQGDQTRNPYIKTKLICVTCSIASANMTHIPFFEYGHDAHTCLSTNDKIG